jgi:hypothetical protein
MIIYQSEQAKANVVDYKRRNTVYRLVNADPESPGFGKVAYHSAVTARDECGMDKETFYTFVTANHPNVRVSEVILIADARTGFGNLFRPSWEIF